MAPLTGMADAIVDITETGTTLRENNLKIFATLTPVSTHLVVNRLALKQKSRPFTSLFSRYNKFVLRRLNMKILTGTLTELQQQVTTRQQTVAQNPAVQTTVQKILADVKLNGDKALLAYNATFDDVAISDLRVPQAQINAAMADLSPKLLAALTLAKKHHQFSPARNEPRLY